MSQVQTTDRVKVEITETNGVKLLSGQYAHGDVVSLPSGEAKIVCENGWGHAPGGEFEKGERDNSRPRSIDPHDLIQENPVLED